MERVRVDNWPFLIWVFVLDLLHVPPGSCAIAFAWPFFPFPLIFEFPLTRPPAALPPTPIEDPLAPVGDVEVPAVPRLEADVPPAAALPPLPIVAEEPPDPAELPPVAAPLALCAAAKLTVLKIIALHSSAE
jgi:hypothetical protein